MGVAKGVVCEKLYVPTSCFHAAVAITCPYPNLSIKHIFLTMPEGMNVWWQAQTVDGDVEADMLYRLKKTDFEMTLLQDFHMAGLRDVRTVRPSAEP